MLPERLENGKLPAFAFPGGYPIYYMTKGGHAICPKCANRDVDDGDCVTGSDLHMEGPSMICDECSAEITSAYGDPANTETIELTAEELKVQTDKLLWPNHRPPVALCREFNEYVNGFYTQVFNSLDGMTVGGDFAIDGMTAARIAGQLQKILRIQLAAINV